jgi:hypothetical protein
MEILAYGEDALTLWALKNKLEYILQELGDLPNSSKRLAFFRPSFGRRGGKIARSLGNSISSFSPQITFTLEKASGTIHPKGLSMEN